MKAPKAPPLDERRTVEFSAELRERAHVWIPSWGLADNEHDFGRALLEIAARFNSEVAERLDDAGEKMRRGFLDWLGVRGEAARPARMPVVFKLADTAREGVLAAAPVRMQVDASGTPVVFETEEDVQIVPGRLEVVVGVDGGKDAFYLPPPGLSDLKPLEPLPTEWQLRSFAASGATVLQLDPESGLLPEMILEAAGQQYRIVKVEKDLVTIEPPLAGGLAPDSSLTKVTTFSPFDDKTRNQQEHALYLGDSELLNVEAAATIEVIGASVLQEGFVWQYWGKVDKGDGNDTVAWQELPLAQDQAKPNAVVLAKPKGAMEQLEIAGKKSRWIRAFTKTILADAAALNVDAFTLRINSSACGILPTQCPPAIPIESPQAEAMANTSPLVLDNIFLPFGREPRQFDTFYLGSTEAFSKKGAQVRICFELADPTFASLAVVRGSGQLAKKVLAGVGRDRGLHLFQFSSKDGSPTVSRFLDRDALRPPIPGDSGVIPPETKPRLLNPACKPLITALNDDFYVSVASAGTIWTWHEKFADGKLSGWQAPDQLPIPPDTAHLDDLVCVDASPVPTVVLSSGRLWVRSQAVWSEKSTEIRTDPDNPQPVELVALVPILKGTNLDDLKAEPTMVGVSKDNKLYKVATDGACTLLPLEPVDAGSLAAGANPQRAAIRPATHKSADGTLIVVTASSNLSSLVMFQKKDSNAPTVDRVDLPEDDQIIGAGVELSFVTGNPQFSVLCKTKAGATYVASWQPAPSVPNAIVKKFLIRSPVSNLGTLGGAPVTLSAHIVAPGVRGDLFVAPFAPNERHVIKVVNPREGAVLPTTDPLFLQKDVLSVVKPDGLTRIRREIAENAIAPPNSPENVLYPVTTLFGEVAQNPEFLGYRVAKPPNQPFVGQINADLRKMELAATDHVTVEGTVLLIKVDVDIQLYTVVEPIAETIPRVAKLDRDLPAPNKATDYWTPEALKGEVAPMLDFDDADGNWLAAYVGQARLYFSSPVAPNVQRAKAFGISGLRPTVIALAERWGTPPAVNELYVLDATFGDWQHLLADTSSNPELSWEYSNGTAWESLILEEEGTLNFKNTGAIRFKVPKDLAAVDWAGKTNHWIRARLIGGDYGREEVSVQTKAGDPTKQIVVRDASGIHAPAVVKLHISYGFCNEISPTFVLAKDSGTIRDQSDANRTPGAIVEAFVPLALTLGRLTKPVAAAEAVEPTKDSSSECDCETPAPTTTGTKSTAGKASRNERRVTGRELYIGLEATLSKTPVNVLLLVDEHNYTEFAPLEVKALIADRFESIVTDDATRALGESGVLSMSFPNPPTRGELFGKENLTWLRLSPTQGNENWIPTLRGAYLNAAWASATETLTRELLGSSDGAPHLVVRLARPPVLDKTLELRVKEPLGEEERTALLDGDSNSVLNKVEGLPGDWVLWKQVVDPDDEGESARVYSLDERTGEIRFGDGRHGKIPPIARDSIVAFSYCRTEPDPKGGDGVPGNTIAPRTALNLVSPVATVETVTAADQAVGGAPAEPDDRVLRFGFARQRHRGRAVTAYDLEDLALQSSPDIVQAHAFVRRSYVRLVVVMRGKNPRPSAAQIRELRRFLLASAPLSLSAPDALRIDPPTIRRLRIELTLLVEALNRTGEVSASVTQKLEAFFDTATGGLDKDGWALGANPGESDIALAISDAPYLESIEKVTPLEITGDGSERLWVDAAAATEMVMLDDDPVRFVFQTAEVMA